MELKRGPSVRIVTPEGLTCDFEVAQSAERIMAFVVDLFIVVAALIAAWILALSFGVTASLEFGVAMGLLGMFFLRHWYFAFFELRGSGTTPGKRSQGLCVIARDGGPLDGEMIVARNLVRDVEFFIPVAVLSAPTAVVPTDSGLVALLAIAWLLVFMFLPFFNRYGLRCGDLIAGTVVIRNPKGVLLPDVAEYEVRANPFQRKQVEAYTFSADQLQHYGVKELQILEDLFRRHEEERAPLEVLKSVGERIRKKIEWPEADNPQDELRFLHDFYRAQRAHLERKMLFGKRKESKHDEGG